jgi:hypothetical protein
VSTDPYCTKVDIKDGGTRYLGFGETQIALGGYVHEKACLYERAMELVTNQALTTVLDLHGVRKPRKRKGEPYVKLIEHTGGGVPCLPKLAHLPARKGVH